MAAAPRRPRPGRSRSAGGRDRRSWLPSHPADGLDHCRPEWTDRSEAGRRGRSGGPAQPGGCMTSPDAAVRLARAWLSRTFEPGSGAVYRYVAAHGAVEAVGLIRAGQAPARGAAAAAARLRDERAGLEPRAG